MRLSDCRSRLFPFLLALAWADAPAAAQDPDRLAATAPAVADTQGLALSGGSARGLAHIGVLLQLEAVGHDPDIVVGTSMGAVVGALYAAGHDAGTILDRTRAIDWSTMFDPTPSLMGPRRVLRRPMASFSLDLARGSVSRGLFGEWRINRALVRLLFDANARARGDFDRLPRRYRAVAADLETGERVELATGDLARAVRASLAYPGFFAPVSWDGRLLIDGGIVDNLPTAVARGLGAGHVVAVDVNRPREEVALEPLAVAGRALALMQQNLASDSLPPDVLILPEVAPAGVGPAFPADPEPLAEAGREAAAGELPPASRRPRARSSPPAPERFAQLRVEAPDSPLAALTRRVFSDVVPGPYDPDAVLRAADDLYATGLVEGVWPTVAAQDRGSGDGATLVVRIDAAPRLGLTTGAGFDTDRGGRAWGALERTTGVARRPLVLGATASTDGIERWVDLSARLYTGTSPAVAWSLGTHILERSVRSYLPDARTTIEVLRVGGWMGLDFPHILRDRVITVVGVAERVDPEDGPGEGAFGPVLRLAAVPSGTPVVGRPLLLEAEARWGGSTYQRIVLAGSREASWSDLRAAAVADVRAVSADAPLDVRPALGDGHAIPGLRWGELRGRARIVLGADAAVPIGLGGLARVRLRTGAVAGAPVDWASSSWVTGLQIGGVWQAPIGVVEVGYGHATVGDGRLDVSLGRSF